MAVRGNKGCILSGLLLAAMLTGCEGTASQLPSVTAAETAQSEAGPEGTKDAGPQAEPKTAALPPAPVIDDDPARVLGLSPDKLTEMLGRPDLTRREPPAEIWQYRGETCVFDVFLYEEAGSARVTYLEARDESAHPVAERNCLNQLLRARIAKPLG